MKDKPQPRPDKLAPWYQKVDALLAENKRVMDGVRNRAGLKEIIVFKPPQKP